MLAKFHKEVWEAGADEEQRTDYDLAGVETVKHIIALFNSVTERAEKAESDLSYLSTAVGTGFLPDEKDFHDPIIAKRALRAANAHKKSATEANARADALRARIAESQKQEPVNWKMVNQAILAVDEEAASRGSMFPQTSDEQREDREAVRRVTGMIEWYATSGGSVAMKLDKWPKFPASIIPPTVEEAVKAALDDVIADAASCLDWLKRYAPECERAEAAQHVQNLHDAAQAMAGDRVGEIYCAEE